LFPFGAWLPPFFKPHLLEIKDCRSPSSEVPAASGGILEAAEAEVDVEIWDEVEMPGEDVEFTTLWAVRAKALNVISGMDRAFKGSH